MIDDGSPGNEPPSGRVSAWLSAIEDAAKSEGMAQYDDRCKVIRKRYRYEGSNAVRTRRFQLFWSNIETMKGAVYSKPPQATVSRRYRDADPVGRVASEILERAVNFTFDSSDFDGVFKKVRDDFLLYARGCARIYYEPEYEAKDDLNEDISDAESIAARPGGGAPDNPQEEQETIKFENVRIRFIQRNDFRHQPARTWPEVQWVAFRAFMTRAEVTERFGKKIGEEIGLDSDPAMSDDQERPGAATPDAKATIWEIWDKAKNQVLWIAKGWPDVLEEGEPYLVLDGFYPCPMPAYGTLTTDSLVPVPDYIFYQDQCEEIDQLTARIGALSDALKLVGFYPAGPQGEGSPEIEIAFKSGFENKLIAVQAWSVFTQGGGGAPVVFLPIDQVIKVLEGCVTLRKQLIEDVYQIIGISDIMRGATDPQETEGAQQLKAQFGGTRIRDRQQEIARFCRDIGRLCGQVIASYCSPETIEKMTNIDLPTRQEVELAQLQATQQAQLAQMQGQPQPPPPPMQGPTQEDVFGLLQDALTRRFKIDIENESTISGDESQERKDRSEFIVSTTNFMEAWGPMMMQKPELAPLGCQLLLFGVRAFRVGRELEETLEELADKLQSSAQNTGPPPPDPMVAMKMQAEQLKLEGTKAKTEAEIARAQIEGQTAQMTGQQKIEAEQLQSAVKIAELRMKLAAAEQEHHHKTVEAGIAHGAAVDKMAIQAQKQAAAKPPAWPKNQQGF